MDSRTARTDRPGVFPRFPRTRGLSAQVDWASRVLAIISVDMLPRLALESSCALAVDDLQQPDSGPLEPREQPAHVAGGHGERLVMLGEQGARGGHPRIVRGNAAIGAMPSGSCPSRLISRSPCGVICGLVTGSSAHTATLSSLAPARARRLPRSVS